MSPTGMRRRGPGKEGMSEEYAEESVGRTPPQDLQAEQSVLGAMLMSKDAISDVVEVLRGSDFYQPKHETIFEAFAQWCYQWRQFEYEGHVCCQPRDKHARLPELLQWAG